MRSEFNNWYEKWTGSKVKCENTDIIGAWQHQQTKVDELTKQRDSFIKAYEIEMDKSVDLQKRLDALIQKYKDEDRELKLIDEWEKSQIYGLVASELEQAIKGGSDE